MQNLTNVRRTVIFMLTAEPQLYIYYLNGIEFKTLNLLFRPKLEKNDTHFTKRTDLKVNGATHAELGFLVNKRNLN